LRSVSSPTLSKNVFFSLPILPFRQLTTPRSPFTVKNSLAWT
uniref:Uncharacterized protein n=1 Tax=Hymenolepis diminuta TaxID=6216 RepID=A0A0R3SNE3_HYMDI